MRKVALIVLLVGAVGVLGCTNKSPVIKDSIYFEGMVTKRPKVGTLAITAQRRIVLMSAGYDSKNRVVARLCAEPPPDAVDNISSQFASALKAGLEGKGGAELAVASQYIQEAQLMLERTQGLQMFRDGNYALCQMYLDGAIDKEDYKFLYERTLNATVALTEKELPNIGASRTAYYLYKANKNATAEPLDDQIDKVKILRDKISGWYNATNPSSN